VPRANLWPSSWPYFMGYPEVVQKTEMLNFPCGHKVVGYGWLQQYLTGPPGYPMKYGPGVIAGSHYGVPLHCGELSRSATMRAIAGLHRGHHRRMPLRRYHCRAPLFSAILRLHHEVPSRDTMTGYHRGVPLQDGITMAS
jgi:hypothetical protein